MRARDGVAPVPGLDYSRRLRADAEEELGPYLIPGFATAKETAEIGKLAADAAKVTAETALVAGRGAADVSKLGAETSKLTAETARVTSEQAKLGAETSKLTAETGRVSDERSKLVAEASRIGAQAGKVSDERARLVARATRDKTEALLAQVEAGVISVAEMRAALGYAGSAPVSVSATVLPVEASGASREAQTRVFGRAETERFGGEDAGMEGW